MFEIWIRIQIFIANNDKFKSQTTWNPCLCAWAYSVAVSSSVCCPVGLSLRLVPQAGSSGWSFRLLLQAGSSGWFFRLEHWLELHCTGRPPRCPAAASPESGALKKEL